MDIWVCIRWLIQRIAEHLFICSQLNMNFQTNRRQVFILGWRYLGVHTRLTSSIISLTLPSSTLRIGDRLPSSFKISLQRTTPLFKNFCLSAVLMVERQVIG